MDPTASLQAQGLSRLGDSITHTCCRDILPLNFLGMCPTNPLPVDADGGKLLPNILIDG